MKKTFTPMLAKLPLSLRERHIEPEKEFLRRVAQECRRAERSKQRFLLVLVEGFGTLRGDVSSVTASVAAVTREIDSLGWYEFGSTLGVLFAELGAAKVEGARDTILEKVQAALLEAGNTEELTVSVFILPRDLNRKVASEARLSRVYEHLEPLASPDTKLQLRIKRAIDLIGSALLLVALSPLMALIAIAVKCGSPGPVLFRQARVGQRGRHFAFLKFRSMKVENDPSLHENYVKEFIRGTAAKHADENGEGVFKLTQDPRVTPVGRLLRRTSLDELPQLWNVLKGEMSLVGPRPPIPYEVECYDLWHQRRVLELKPGITGLWQVCGRSRTDFDGMVRLDLQYARTWSPWLDLKILLRTPLAVLAGGGAH